MTNEQIHHNKLCKKLQENTIVFGKMPKEMQAKAIELRTANFLIWQGGKDGKWKSITGSVWDHICTYCLRPDYEEKSETVECHVFIHDLEKRLVFTCTNGITFSLVMGPALPDFIGFKYEDGYLSPMPRRYKHLDSATAMVVNEKSEYKVLTPTHVLFKKG